MSRNNFFKRTGSVLVVAFILCQSVMGVFAEEAESTEVPSGAVSEEVAEHVSAEPAAGSSKSKAETITFGKNTVGSFTSTANNHWYKFKTTGNDSFYKLTFLNINIDSSTYVGLYDSNDKQIFRFSCYSNSEDYEEYKLNKNTAYYIKVDRSNNNKSGKYQFTVKETKDDVGDSKSKSTSLSLGKTFKGALDGVGDEDWFKFKATGKNSFYRVKLLNVNIDSICQLYLYDENDVQLFELNAYNNNTDYEDIKIENKKNYYIKIKAYNKYRTGKYQVSVEEKADDVPDTKQKSLNINANKVYNKALNARGDVDWFKFKAESTSKHRIVLKNVNIDWRAHIKIYNADDVLLDEATVYENRQEYRDFKFTKNKTYYIKVSGYRDDEQGKYQLTIKNPVSVKVKEPSKISAKSSSYNSNKISWKKADGVNGYIIYGKSSKNGSYKKLGEVSASKNSYTHKKLKNNNTYYYKVRAYKKVGSLTYYSKYTKQVSAKPSVSKPGNYNVKKSGATGARLTWKKTSGATGYEIYRSVSPNKGYKKVKTVGAGNTSFINTGLKKGKIYYYKIRSYKKAGNKKYYSSYTKKIAVKF